MNNNTKIFLICSGITLVGSAVIGAISYATTKTLVNAALDRELPKRMKNKKISHLEGDEAAKEEVRKKAEKLKNSDCKTVEIISRDHKKLIGHWHNNENAKRIVIAMHGWRSSWTKDFGVISDFWHENDCSVLYAEQRGQNSSEGDFMGFGMIERYDCLDWINWANEQGEKKLPIYLAGVSMGASTVLMTSGFDLPKNVCGIMADCGFTSAKAIWKHVLETNMHLSYKMRSKMIEDLCKKKININSEDYTTVDALKKNKIPILFVHGTDDDFVPIEMTYENYKACAAPKKLLVVPGATHAMSYVADKTGYENAIKAFWKDCDKPVTIDNEILSAAE